MKTPIHSKFFPVFFMLVLAGCGGGGGGGGGGSGGGGSGSGADAGGGGSAGGGAGAGGNPGGVDNTAQTLLPCINTATNLCSGSTILLSDNNLAPGVTLTDSGVQVYGKSTSDLAANQSAANTTQAWGLAPDSGGLAEIRLEKNASGVITRAGMLLSQIGIRWDTVKDRPQILEIFSPTQGRATLGGADTNRSIMFGPLPPSSDLNHYDWAVKGAAGTQANYANNVYFPRSEPIRCPAGDTGCSTTYTPPSIERTPGNWQSTFQPVQTAADEISVFRRHEDGDLRAGDDVPDANGNRRWISDSDGFGVSYPGFKGYRNLSNWSYRYANLATWLTQDTVEIVEWSGGANEHNKNRRGFVAFGEVTAPATVPTSGTATYTGGVYGYYASKAVAASAADDVASFRGVATVTVNFATRTASVSISQTRSFDDEAREIPATLTATISLDANQPNYARGAVNNTGSSMSGGLGARFFGPIVGSGPAEIGGTITMTSSASTCQATPNNCQTAIVGFIGKQ